MPLPIRLTAVAAALLVVACGDGSTHPSTATGLYRLVSVNGMSLPAQLAPSMGGPTTITHGDLLLHGDGSFAIGVANDFAHNILTPEPGQWRLTRRELRLTFGLTQSGAAPVEAVGTLDGDSVVVVIGPTYVFRRVPRPRPSIESGSHIVTSLNGGPDLAFEYVHAGDTFRLYVLYDSIMFIDGVFFRWHRAEGTARLMPGAEPLVHERSWVVPGSYVEANGRLVLRAYMSSVYTSPRTADTLQIGTGALARHRQIPHPVSGETMPWIELYTPVP